MKNFDPRSLLAIAAGIIVGIGVYIILGVFFFISGMITWGNHSGIQDARIDFLAATMGIVSGLAAGWTSSRVANKAGILHALITGIFLMLALAFMIDFDIKGYDAIQIILEFICCLAGGWIGKKK